MLEDGRQWWKLRSRSGQAGYVPCNILGEARPEDAGAPFEQVSPRGSLGSQPPSLLEQHRLRPAPPQGQPRSWRGWGRCRAPWAEGKGWSTGQGRGGVLGRCWEAGAGHGEPDRLPPPQVGQKYWGPASPTHKLPPSFPGNKDGESCCFEAEVPGPGPPGGGRVGRSLGRGRGQGQGSGGPESRPPSELMQHMDEVNDELIRKISNIRAQPQRHFRVERSQPVSQPLTYESGPDEVRAWLEAKAFSAR